MDLGVGLEGWIGGLVAAAVTLAFTAWWETRQHRRRQMDDQVAALASAQQAYALAVLRMAATGWDAIEMSELVNRVAAAQLRAASLVGRRVLNIPARFVAPGREGLRRTLATSSRQWAVVAQKRSLMPPLKTPTTSRELAANVDAVKLLFNLAMAQVSVCAAWEQNPWRFFPGRDRSEWAKSEASRLDQFV